MWIARLGALGSVLLVGACGSSSTQSLSAGAGSTTTPDPKYLVLQLSDLPPGWAPVPGERLRVPLTWVLGDPWSAGLRPLIRRERTAGYEASYWSPERRRVECEVALYRSGRSAKRVFALRARSYGSFVRAQHLGRSISVQRVGDATSAFRMDGRLKGFAVLWRYRNVLSGCKSVGPGPDGLSQTLALAVLQQQRLTRMLGRPSADGRPFSLRSRGPVSAGLRTPRTWLHGIVVDVSDAALVP